MHFISHIKEAIGNKQNHQTNQQLQDYVGPDDQNRQNKHNDAVDYKNTLDVGEFLTRHFK